MKIDLVLFCFIIIGAIGNITLLNMPFTVQVLMLPWIGGYFGYSIYKNEFKRSKQ